MVNDKATTRLTQDDLGTKSETGWSSEARLIVTETKKKTCSERWGLGESERRLTEKP